MDGVGCSDIIAYALCWCGIVILVLLTIKYVIDTPEPSESNIMMMSPRCIVSIAFNDFPSHRT